MITPNVVVVGSISVQGVCRVGMDGRILQRSFSVVSSFSIARIGFGGQAYVPAPIACIILPVFAGFARPLNNNFELKVVTLYFSPFSPLHRNDCEPRWWVSKPMRLVRAAVVIRQSGSRLPCCPYCHPRQVSSSLLLWPGWPPLVYRGSCVWAGSGACHLVKEGTSLLGTKITGALR